MKHDKAPSAKKPFLRKHTISVSAAYLPLLFDFVGKGDPRYYLNGFYAEPCKECPGAILVGTDGHKLVAIHDADAKVAAPYINPITKAMVSAATKKLADSDPGDRMAYFAGDAVHITKGFTRTPARLGAHTILSETNTPIDGVFPAWRRIIEDARDRRKTPRQVFAVNADYMAQAVKHVRSKYREVQIDNTLASQSVLVRYPERPEILIVLMPMKCDTLADQFPEWLGLPAARSAKKKKKKAAKS